MEDNEFWRALDKLISESEIIIDRPRGSCEKQSCDAVICTIDLLKKDSEIKILLGCNEDEKNIIPVFM